VTDILIPESGDFEAWEATRDVCIAVDWDGTCKDTMVPKWTRGFNLAVPEIWPALRPYQPRIDEVCYEVNITEEATAGVQRFVALKIMMRRWAEMGLPVPDLERFFAAVDAVEQRGEKHGVATYERLRAEFGYDDSPLRWSDLSDRVIAESTRDAVVFPHCRETLSSIAVEADLVVVSASKTEAVRADLERDDMVGLFRALLAQDFLPKSGTLRGLAGRYERVLFVGDTQHDVRAARSAGVPIYLVAVGREGESWAAAGAVVRRFIAGAAAQPELIYPVGIGESVSDGG